MSQPDDRHREHEPRAAPGRARPSPALLFVIVLTAVVMAAAVLVAVWMYWLEGAVPA